MRMCIRMLLLVALDGCVCGCGHPARTTAPSATAPSPPVPREYSQRYHWLREEPQYEALIERTPTPPGFTRVSLADGTWGHWLRYLPVRRAGIPVTTLAGEIAVPGNADYLAAVIDIDVRKNQDCADTIMRLLSEYLRYKGRADSLAFPVGHGGKIAWTEWQRGVRPHLVGSHLEFASTGRADASRASFDRYLDSVFAWCGTVTLPLQTVQVASQDLQVGDVFTQAGSPAHCVLVADLARSAEGHCKGLILQGYLPAQSPHVVKPLGPWAWVDLDPALPVDVPRGGRFEWSTLRRFSTPKP